ncbi:L-2-hydroxyglutarate oxidase [Motiliproteus sp.]|uniref:L-2-hydroxyglutarate oxidase n=1 Tax=Motiliproteus sp. TaxID=1898955 RepID=UPI003BAC9F72
MNYDFVIVGGGIVGLSTAWQLQQRFPDKCILLLEKESGVARHQTGHNSGVIHAGIYYAPGSLKARFCKQGVDATMAFCRQHDIAFDQCGKLLVATNPLEHERMLALYQRALQNGLEVELLDAQQLREAEPHIIGSGAIRVKTTGIVDYTRVCEQMAECFQQLGGEVRLSTEVVGLQENAQGVVVKTRAGESIQGGFLISCSGLMADRTTRMLGIPTDFQIVPYRGEYYRLAARHNQVVKHLIYPIPDPDLPFLGVHLTRMIDGSVTVGPNAVQGWKREGYSPAPVNFSLRDSWEMLRFAGWWKLTAANFRTGMQEWKNSLFKSGYLKLVRKYCPRIEREDLQPYPTGIRAQAVMKDGSLVHDFLFAESPHSLHVCNAPSPAATSAIPIGAYICDQVQQRVG